MDKLHHAVYSAAITFAASLLLDGVAAGAVIALIIGAVKEIVWDHYMRRGHPDWWDILANVIGVSGAAVVIMWGGSV